MSDKKSQRINAPEHLGLISISDAINSVKGATATVLTRPVAATTSPFAETPKTLAISVEVGSFRIQIGDTSATISNAAPGTTTSDGSSGLLLTVGVPVAFTAPSKVTVIGSSASDILTYWWI